MKDFCVDVEQHFAQLAVNLPRWVKNDPTFLSIITLNS